jgi:hypothetical protein
VPGSAVYHLASWQKSTASGLANEYESKANVRVEARHQHQVNAEVFKMGQLSCWLLAGSLSVVVGRMVPRPPSTINVCEDGRRIPRSAVRPSATTSLHA